MLMNNMEFKRKKWTYFDVKYDKWETKIFHCINFILIQKENHISSFIPVFFFCLVFSDRISFCFVLIISSDSIQQKQLIKSLYKFRFNLISIIPLLLCSALLWSHRHAQVWVISESFTQKISRCEMAPRKVYKQLVKNNSSKSGEAKKLYIAASYKLQILY